jgi:endonuclease/exonuclease/phosphatase family metal-dependent hydrolase
MMGRFRRLLNELELVEIDLLGRQFTWSNEREAPTLVRLDRVFVTTDWDQLFPDCILQALASSISDHCPLLLGEGLHG